MLPLLTQYKVHVLIVYDNNDLREYQIVKKKFDFIALQHNLICYDLKLAAHNVKLTNVIQRWDMGAVQMKMVRFD